MKQKLTDTNYTVSRGGRVEDYWMTRVMHPHYAQEEAKQQEVDMVAILKEYKLKGFEFGNWVNQNDRYDFIHAFTRSAQILSEIIGSKNIGLDLLVGVAFGARGRGGGAVAHYEPMHNMINLTKEKSYGSLAHEWGHAIDYNLGRHIDQNKDYSFLTGGHSVAAILPTNTGAQLRMWANAVVDEAKATPSYKRIEKADEYWHRRTEVWARFMEQYVAYQCKLKKKSPRYLALTFEEYTKMTPYWTEADFVKIARGSMFSFMAVLKGVLNNRYNLTASPYKYKTRDMLYPKPGKAPKPKYTLPLYVVLKGRKPTDSNMLKFDKNMANSGNTRTPYGWLKYACDACGVPLGVTEQQVAAMPNGTRNLSWTNTDDVKTYRDLIAQVATVLCGVCQIDRMGRLVVIPFTNTPVMNIPASWRYSSKIADYITKYTGLYATYRAGGVTEYYKVEPDDGLIYNIGTNPLLQIASTTERGQILQAIINNLAATTYTPFEAEIPGDPAIDPMDVLSLSGGQARNEVACITEIVYRINGKSSIKCVGENPRLNQA